MREILRFAAVGIVGFVLDAGSLLLLVTLVGWLPLPARVASFVIAASGTFVLNHRFTFSSSAAGAGRWLAYLAFTAGGAFINIGIYHLWTRWAGASPEQLVAGSAVGSLAAMCFNFAVSKWVIFRPGAPT